MTEIRVRLHHCLSYGPKLVAFLGYVLFGFYLLLIWLDLGFLEKHIRRCSADHSPLDFLYKNFFLV